MFDASDETPAESGEAAAGGEASGGRPTSPTSEPQASELVSGHCESCGRDDEEVVSVHRVYVTPETWDTEGKVDVLDEVEKWCFACRSHYPHQEV